MEGCQAGLVDCGAPSTLLGDACAAYASPYPSLEGSGTLLWSGVSIAVLMAFCIGGNDSANSWATTVGSGALPLRHALLLGGMGEWLGATLLGQGVSNTIQKGVSHTDDPACWGCGFCDSRMSVYAVGMLGALIGAAVFLLAATFGKMPVSTTHAIVGGVIGMTVAGTSGSCLAWDWHGLGGIIASWVISPVLSGVIAAAVYVLTDKLAVRSRSPVRRTILALPILYALTTFIMVSLTIRKSKPTRNLPLGIQLAIATALALLAFGVVQLLVVPRVRRSVTQRFPGAMSGSGPNAVVTTVSDAPTTATSAGPAGSPVASTQRVSAAEGVVEPVPVVEDASTSNGARSAGGVEMTEVDLSENRAPGGGKGGVEESGSDLKIVRFGGKEPSTGRGPRNVAPRPPAEEAAVFVFRYLLVFVAFLESFAHGANDTANATSAFAAVWNAYTVGLHACSNIETPWWIMSAAGLCVALGVNLMGHRVIQTIGEDLTAIDYHVGFAIEFASTLTVMIATVIGGLPLSTTHCQVGAVVFTGFIISGRKGVDLRLFGKIALTWVLTLPLAGGLAALLTAIFRAAIQL